MKIYNSLRRQLEDFVPLNPEQVSIYSCGPTVYDYIHMGNARTALVTDIIRRYLVYKGYNVKLVQNLTDIDDKIINRAAELGVSAKQLAHQNGEAFFEDSQRLGIQPADVHPKATEHIPEMIDLIQILLDKGAAYVIDGSVYYRVNQFAEYGKLSNRKPEDLLAGARVEIDERKEDPRDFDMWKAVKPGEPSWESPWGRGRPGWHIECSAMAMKHLGETIDIHAGGEDLQFPHHENEIAQSELATGTPFARYWMHVAFLKIDGKRMGKSEHNFILLRDALDNYPTEVIRHFLISAHYRHPLDYNRESLTKSEGALRRLNNCLDALKNYYEDIEPSHAVQEMKSQFTLAMDTDFNTAQALGAIFTLVGEVNKSLSTLDEAAAPVLAQAYQALTETCQVLGIYNTDTQIDDGDNVQQRDQMINLLLEIRQDARNRKDWETSDKIRDRLKELNIEIKDTREGTTWKIIS
ncbi:Cysteine--tRNA ligase [Geodia barretti]|uniref:Cysteine--tRNA ligase n=1 Tax=Geodia barretti TaxID=519541 RepID=A0AA35W704_GEOBA|nr:Cysteine--tRNA ligase [Geodia barretti]